MPSLQTTAKARIPTESNKFFLVMFSPWFVRPPAIGQLTDSPPLSSSRQDSREYLGTSGLFPLSTEKTERGESKMPGSEDTKRVQHKGGHTSPMVRRWILVAAAVAVAGFMARNAMFRARPAPQTFDYGDRGRVETHPSRVGRETSKVRSNDVPIDVDKQDDLAAGLREGVGSVMEPEKPEPAAEPVPELADEASRKRKDEADHLFEAQQRRKEEFPTLLRDQEEKNAPSSRRISGEVDRMTIGGKTRPLETVPDDVVNAFLDERNEVDGLVFKDARGYWANTYLPGDPAMRFLYARLRSYDTRALEALMGKSFRLHNSVHRVAQPLDAPVSSSLAVYLQADQKSLEGKGRLLVQVGIKGIERQAGRRPAMNVGVILDLRGEIPIDVASGMRALLTELLQAKELGDRIRLVVAGRPGGLVLGTEDFRYGPLSVMLERLLEKEELLDGEALSVDEAMCTALTDVTNDDDPNATLGSSTVLLITGQPIGDAMERLVTLSHKSAVAGIPVSVLGVGGNVDAEEMEQLALAGQGHRRLLERPSEAAGIIDQELTAASRVVARAVRLRIRLGKDVQLVDVLGSESLDEARARQVREAEQSIDLRLARNLGIESDRGDDEDGIQIVIPNFYSGDEHVVLLDVVAPGSGPVADVTVRYKDLAFVRNGVARASLAMKRGDEVTGALEWNVVGNLLSFELARSLELAGNALVRADAGEASRFLTRHRDLLHGLGSKLAGVDANDTRDSLNLLNEYIGLVETEAIQQDALRCFLADSLRYASWLKRQPPMGP